MEKIKIIVVSTTDLRLDGITKIIFDYYSRFDMRRFEIVACASGESDIKLVNNFKRSGISIVYLNSRKKNTIKYIVDLYRYMLREKFDAIHVHGNSATMAIELFIAKLAGCPIRISHSHNSTCDAKKLDRILRPLFYRSYTHAFACGELAGKWLYQNRKYDIVKNGRDINAYIYNNKTRQSIRSTLGLQDDEIALGNIGNFNEQKNHAFLINVFSEIQKKNKKAKLFLAGYGHLENDLRCQVKEYGLEDKVYFLGSINNVPEVLQGMDIMVLTSLHEGLPLVVIEWQIAGLPCFISDNISKECVFTDLVKSVSLNAGAEYWADLILNCDMPNRESTKAEISQLALINGYDIDESAKKLEKFFEDNIVVN